jgi:hypothetical protein
MQTKINIIAALVFAIPILHAADDPKYPVSAIPADLRENAMAVLRNSIETFVIKSEGKGTYSRTYAITVLNENGLDEARFMEYYSQKLQRINSVRGTIYDAAGKKVESLSQDKIIDQSMIAGYSLYEDQRIKHFTPKTMTYPFTAEYSYDVEFDGLFNIPEWTPITDYNTSVEHSIYRIICPAGKQIRYNTNTYAGQPVITNENGTNTYTWELKDLPACEEQPYSGPFSLFSPLVQICPNRFEIEGYSGDYNTWDDFGKWINSVNTGRDVLSEATIQVVKDIVKDCKSDRDKACKIYEYMQAKTRYVNITVGIGGWQPIPAETVDRLGYGDCKALSNYTIALLKAAGIKAYYALIMAGANVRETDQNFPNNRFNHVIVFLPLTDDTIWLECTSQIKPFGYIGTFINNRKALVIKDNGAQLIQTRSYTEQENLLTRNSTLILDNNGAAKIKTCAIHNGLLYDDKLPYYIAGNDDRKRMIHSELNIPGCILLNVDYKEKHESMPYIREDLEVEVPRYATVSGPRLLVSMLPAGRLQYVPKKVTNRNSDVILKRSVASVDSITIAVPDGFRPEALPAEVKTESVFGYYSLKTQILDNNRVLCVRRMVTKEGKYPPEKYNELVDFYKKVALSDNAKISLIQL